MKRAFFLSSWALFLPAVLPACGPSVRSGTGGSGGTGGTNDTGVTVLLIDDYELDGVKGQRPVDTSGIESIAALVKKGSGYETYPGTLSSGQADIPDVPEGPYVLQIRRKPDPDLPEYPQFTRYVTASARVLDFGSDAVGRADVEILEPPATATLRVTGGLSSPWAEPTYDPDGNPITNAYDRLEIYSREAGSYGIAVDSGDGLMPVGGDTSVDWPFDATYALETAGWPPAAIDASKGDSAVIVRQRNDLLFPDPATAPDAAWATATYDRVVDAQPVTSFTLKPGDEALASGDLAPSGGDVTFDFVYEKAAAAPFIDAVGVPTTAVLTFFLYVEPGVAVPSISASPLLVNIFAFGSESPANPTCFPDDMGACDPGLCPSGCDDTLVPPVYSDLTRTFQDRNPFNPDATIIAYASVVYGRRVPNPGDGATARLNASYVVSGKAESMSGKPIATDMGLVRNIQVGGSPSGFDDLLEGVGTGPTVSWDAPSAGSPQLYAVAVRDENNVVDSMGNVLATVATVAEFRTHDTEVTFPEGTLEAGHYYSFRVAAIRDGVARSDDAPNHWKSFDTTSSFLSSGLVTP